MIRDSRALTPVLGLVILFGLVAIASVGILLVAGQTTGDIEQNAEKERIEGAFVELSAELETAASSSDVSRAMDLTLEDYRDDLHYEETGELSVSVDNETVYESSLGSLEYTAADGTKIVYQAGGVWRDDGDGIHAVSGPNVHVHNESITLPVAVLNSSDDLHAGTVSMDSTGSQSVHSSMVQDPVTIEITSQYYQWWESHFRAQLGDEHVSVTDTGSSDGETVSITFDGESTRSLGLDLNYGITVNQAFTSDTGSSGPTIASDIVAEEIVCGDTDESYSDTPESVECDWLQEGGGYDASLDETSGITSIDSRVVDTADRARTSGIDRGSLHVRNNNPQTLENDLYYADDLKLDDELTVDLSNGDVTVVVGPGGIDGSANGELTVENVSSGNVFQIYNTGDLEMSGQYSICAEECDGKNTSAIQYFGLGGTDVQINNPDTIFEGVMIVPTNDVRLTSGDIYGSVVADNVEIGTANGYFEYDDALDDVDISIDRYLLPEKSVYVNVVVDEIDLTNE